MHTAAGTNRLRGGSLSATIPPFAFTRPLRKLLQTIDRVSREIDFSLWPVACN
jgi:hypothetical protein